MEQVICFSVKALIIKNNSFLAVYSFKHGLKLWDLPGGRMEFGETAEQTLKREIFEELSIEVKPIKVIDTWNYIHGDKCQITGIIYYCEMVTDIINLSVEHSGFNWIPFNKIDQMFTKAFLLEKMQQWNWDSIVDNKLKFTK